MRSLKRWTKQVCDYHYSDDVILLWIPDHHRHDLFVGCDMLMKNRVHDPNCKPGALWHIFHPGDTPKIRDLLKKVALENGKRLDPHDDPIHDQSTYLDGELRMRLYKEYGVHGKCINQYH